MARPDAGGVLEDWCLRWSGTCWMPCLVPAAYSQEGQPYLLGTCPASASSAENLPGGQVLLGLCHLCLKTPEVAEQALRQAEGHADVELAKLPKLYPALLGFALEDQVHSCA